MNCLDDVFSSQAPGADRSLFNSSLESRLSNWNWWTPASRPGVTYDIAATGEASSAVLSALLQAAETDDRRVRPHPTGSRASLCGHPKTDFRERGREANANGDANVARGGPSFILQPRAVRCGHSRCRRWLQHSRPRSSPSIPFDPVGQRLIDREIVWFYGLWGCSRRFFGQNSTRNCGSAPVGGRL